MNRLRKLKNFLLLEIGFPAIDLITGSQTRYYLHQISQMNDWSRAEITDWQNQQLRLIIKHFYNTTPYYRKLFDQLGLKPEDIIDKSDLLKIPPLTKDIIQENYQDLIPVTIDKIKHRKSASGGSSGKTLRYLLDMRTWSYTTAIKIYSWQRKGYLYGDKFATVGSTSLFPNSSSLKHKLYHLFKSSVRISGMNLSDEKIVEHLSTLNKEKVKYLYGYAGSLYLIAKYVNTHGLRIPSVKGCFPTSEMLTPEYRAEMEKAFGMVMDCYGARDGGITAYEITAGVYHVGYNAVAEVVDCYQKDTGTLLVTDLLCYSFPFIRYELGDDVTLPVETSGFDYNGQVITKIMGRSPDIIRLSNGHVLTGPAFQMMFGTFNVSAYRIAKAGDLKIRIEIQPTEKFAKEEEVLLQQIIKRHAGQDCDVEIIKNENFQPNKNGKRNYFMA